MQEHLSKISFAMMLMSTMWSCNAAFAGSDSKVHFTRKTYNTLVMDTARGWKQTVYETGTVENAAYTFYADYSQLEDVKIRKVVVEGSNGRSHKFNKGLVNDYSMEGNLFYSGHRAKMFDIQPTKKFEVEWVKTCEELMLLTSLPINSWSKTDTIEHFLTVPIDYRVVFKLTDIDDNITELTIDSSATEGNKVYHLVGVNKRPNVNLKKRLDRGHSPAGSQGVVRVLVIPNFWKGSPREYFNSWYLGLVSTRSEISDEIKAHVDEITTGLIGEDQIRAIFSDIQQSVRYVAVENGLGAFQPRNAVSTWENKYGDCKDMANLLVSTLKYKGFDARMALSASIGHKFKLDFPSLGSANHCICMVQVNGRWVPLDATDFICQYGNPSAHIQETSVFITGPEGGIFHRVDYIPVDENEQLIQVTGTMDEEGYFIGGFKWTFNGMSNHTLAYIKAYTTTEQMNMMLQKIGEMRFEGLDVDFTKNLIGDTSSHLSGTLSSKRSYLSQMGESTLLSLGFIPTLNISKERVGAGFRKVLGGAVNVHITVDIDADELDGKEANKEFNLKLGSSVVRGYVSYSLGSITADLRFKHDNVQVADDEVEKWNKTNNYIRKISKHALEIN